MQANASHCFVKAQDGGQSGGYASTVKVESEPSLTFCTDFSLLRKAECAPVLGMIPSYDHISIR